MAVPAVRESLRRQNIIVFGKIADSNVASHTRILGWFAAFLGVWLATKLEVLLPLLGWINEQIYLFSHSFHTPAGMEAARQVAKTRASNDDIDLALLIFAFSFLFLSFRNRATRAGTFAAALDATAQELNSRLRFQIEDVFQGGKICDVLSYMQPKRGDEIDVMWTFFYREEHNTGLIDYCQQHGIKRVRILLSCPGENGIATRVNDLKGPFSGLGCQGANSNEPETDVWRASAKEIGLDNINFCKDLLRRIEENEAGRRRKSWRFWKAKHDTIFEVRFTPDYVGRPLVIIREGRGSLRQTWLRLTYKSYQNTAAFHPLLLEPERVAMGLYMSKEASAYPFISYYPDPTNAPAHSVSGDTRVMFDARWNSVEPLFPGSATLCAAEKRDIRSEIMRLERKLESEPVVFRTLGLNEARAAVKPNAPVADTVRTELMELNAWDTKNDDWGGCAKEEILLHDLPVLDDEGDWAEKASATGGLRSRSASARTPSISVTNFIGPTATRDPRG